MNRKLAYSIALFAIVGLLAAFFLAGKGRTHRPAQWSKPIPSLRL